MSRSGDMNRGALNSAANSSGPSIGASSLVTDANSALSGCGGGPRLQRSASINTESYTRLPSSPMSFSSNSMMDGSSIVQQEQAQQKQAGSSATSQPTALDPGNSLHVQKRARLDTRQERVLQPQVIQQLIQGHQNPQLQAIFQQQRQQQQQMLQSFPQMQQGPIQMLQQQQLRQHMQKTVQPAVPVRPPLEGGICHRRIMQYMYHISHRQPENSISYWRKFVAEYYAPRAKKRWCLSMYDNVGNHAFGVFPQTAVDAWRCDLCDSKSGKGFEATFEVLPRLNQIKFDSGVISELLFLDIPRESRLSSGIMVLDYAKAVQECVYEQLRVVREGRLQIFFTPELKILTWEFCARRHEEFFSRRSVAPQVNQLLQVAQKYQTAVTESGSSGVSHQDLQASCNMFMTAGLQLARNLELQSLNDLGFSKRYVRCLQISEVVNSMKDVIDFSKEHKMGPIESLRNYPRQAAAKLQNQKMQEVEQQATNQRNLNKIMAFHPGIGCYINNNHLTGTRVLNNTTPSGVTLNNYQNLRRSFVSPNQNGFQPDSPYTFVRPNQTQPMQFQGSVSSILANTSINGLSNPHQQQQQQQPATNGILPQHNNLQSSSEVIQQLLQEVMNHNRGSPQQQLVTPPEASGDDVVGGGSGLLVRMNSGSARNGMGVGNVAAANVSNNAIVAAPSRSNSFRSVANNPTTSGNSLNNSLHLPELDHNISHEFGEDGMFGGEPGDVGYGWKM